MEGSSVFSGVAPIGAGSGAMICMVSCPARTERSEGLATRVPAVERQSGCQALDKRIEPYWTARMKTSQNRESMPLVTGHLHLRDPVGVGWRSRPSASAWGSTVISSTGSGRGLFMVAISRQNNGADSRSPVNSDPLVRLSSQAWRWEAGAQFSTLARLCR
jgi:hypothetical protein